MNQFKNEFKKIEEKIKNGPLPEANRLLQKIKNEYDTILSLRKISPGTSKTKEELSIELENFKNQFNKDNVSNDLVNDLNLIKDHPNAKDIKEVLYERFSRIKEYLDIKD